MTTLTSPHLELRRVAGGNWLIHDHSYPPNDARHVVAWMHRADDDGVEVVWVRRTPLPTRYRTESDAFDDFRHYLLRRTTDRPVPIPHFPPPHAA
jgi:hypothetical protein